MVRQLIAGVMVASFVLAVLGCGEEGKGPAEGAKAGTKGEKKLTFAVIPKAQVFTFWPTVERGAQAAGKEFGVEIIWQGATDETKYIEQQQIVKTMISRKVDGIVLAPTSKTALVDVVKQAVEAKIPVSIVDSAIDTDVYVSFIATDNYQGGVTGARRLAEILGKKGKSSAGARLTAHRARSTAVGSHQPRRDERDEGRSRTCGRQSALPAGDPRHDAPRPVERLDRDGEREGLTDRHAGSPPHRARGPPLPRDLGGAALPRVRAHQRLLRPP